jgi:tetratricopeptide (TPR) repeat protein
MSDMQPDVATSLHNLACLLQNQGKFSDAEIFGQQALEIRGKLFGTNHSDFASTLSALSTIYLGEGRFAEAETAVRNALTIQRVRLGATNYETAVSLNNLGDILRSEGSWTEAETVQREAVGLLKKTLGDESQFAATGMDVLGNLLRDEGKLAEAEACQRDTFTLRKKTLRADNPDIAQSLNDLASVLAAESVSQTSNSQSCLKDAESLLRQALSMRRNLLGKEHPDTLDSLNGLARVLQQRGNLTGAEALARECCDLYEKLYPDDWRAFETRSLLGGILLDQERYAEAEPLLVGGYDGLKRREARIPAHDRQCLKETAHHAVELYESTARPDKATDWKKRLHE